MIKKINHIGIAVKNLEESIAFYQKLGLELESIEEVAEQKVKVAFFSVGDTRIELLAATAEDSPIAKYIEKKGEGIQHIAFTVDNIEKQLEEAKDNQITLIDQTPRIGAHNSQIAFLHPKSTGGVLIEYCQEQGEKH